MAETGSPSPAGAADALATLALRRRRAMENIDLADLELDFKDCLERHKRGDMSEEEASEFNARVIGMFCRRILDTAEAPGPWSERENFAAYCSVNHVKS